MRAADLELLSTYCPEIMQARISCISRTQLLDSLAAAWLFSRHGGGIQPIVSFVAILRSGDGTISTSPTFGRQSDLCQWLGKHRAGRSCTTNIRVETYTTDDATGISTLKTTNFVEKGETK